MQYDKLVAVTNRAICYEKHFNKDFGNDENNYILGSFPLLRQISDENKDACVVLISRLLTLVNYKTPVIILREKDLPREDYKILAQTAIYICGLSSSKLILHSFYDVAVELNCRHIHLPLQTLADIAPTFSLTEHFDSIGSSVHSINDAVLAQSLGASYITAGHVYDTDCKKGLPGRGLDFLRDVCSAVRIPVYAIGGITEDNLSRCIDAGAAMGCMMSGLM